MPMCTAMDTAASLCIEVGMDRIHCTANIPANLEGQEPHTLAISHANFLGTFKWLNSDLSNSSTDFRCPPSDSLNSTAYLQCVSFGCGIAPHLSF